MFSFLSCDIQWVSLNKFEKKTGQAFPKMKCSEEQNASLGEHFIYETPPFCG
jgi:hypothetical protein